MPAPNAPAAAIDKAAIKFESSSWGSSFGAACSRARCLAGPSASRRDGASSFMCSPRRDGARVADSGATGATKPADRGNAAMRPSKRAFRRRICAHDVVIDAKCQRGGLIVYFIIAATALSLRQLAAASEFLAHRDKFLPCKDSSEHSSDAARSFHVAIARRAPTRRAWLLGAAKGKGCTAPRRARAGGRLLGVDRTRPSSADAAAPGAERAAQLRWALWTA